VKNQETVSKAIRCDTRDMDVSDRSDMIMTARRYRVIRFRALRTVLQLYYLIASLGCGYGLYSSYWPEFVQNWTEIE
jgi:hypothetical protein